MEIENIIEIGIDEEKRLYLKPQKTAFMHIYRTASEVNWDADKNMVYAPKPREWTYLKWFCHIIEKIDSEYGIKLKTFPKTNWINIDNNLQNDILNYEKSC